MVELDEIEKPQYEIFSSPIGMKHDIYISGQIESPYKYTKLINLIRGMGSNDCCNITLNSNGGEVGTGIQIISAIESTYGHVHTIVEGEASSMAALIFMAGHQMSIAKHSKLLFHNGSWGFGGKGHEVMAHSAATTVWFDEMTRSLTIPFLTNNEADRILSGLEFYLTTDEVRARFKNVGEIGMDGSTVMKFETLEKWDPDYERPVIEEEVEMIALPKKKSRKKVDTSSKL